MRTQLERDNALLDSVRHSDWPWDYEASDWQAIVAALPRVRPFHEWMRENANNYLFEKSTEGAGPDGGIDSEWVKSQRADAARVAKDARKLLESCEATGLGSATFLDELEALLFRAEHFKPMRAARPIYGGKTNMRMALVERCVQLWAELNGFLTGVQIEPLSADDAANLLDFVWLATRPVLVLGDRFNDGEPGRDALRKQVLKIRHDGLRQKDNYLVLKDWQI